MSVEETTTQVNVVFEPALTIEGLIELVTPERLDLAVYGPARPILLAVSDNGPRTTSTGTGEFIAALAVIRHHGLPHTPTDQAWIETLFGHVRGEWPNLETITDPAELEIGLDRVRHPGIRRARIHGLQRARHDRITCHRNTTINNNPEETR